MPAGIFRGIVPKDPTRELYDDIRKTRGTDEMTFLVCLIDSITGNPFAYLPHWALCFRRSEQNSSWSSASPASSKSIEGTPWASIWLDPGLYNTLGFVREEQFH